MNFSWTLTIEDYVYFCMFYCNNFLTLIYCEQHNSYWVIWLYFLMTWKIHESIKNKKWIVKIIKFSFLYHSRWLFSSSYLHYFPGKFSLARSLIFVKSTCCFIYINLSWWSSDCPQQIPLSVLNILFKKMIK